MKKHPRLTFLIITLLVAFIAIYKQPMTLEEMYGGEISQIFILATTYENPADGPIHWDVEIERGSEEFNLIKDRKFIRSLKTFIFDPFPKSHKIEEGDYEWVCYANCNGERVMINNWYGDVTINGDDGKRHIIAIDKNDPWLKEVFDTAAKYAK